jgi:hypothetical protein
MEKEITAGLESGIAHFAQSGNEKDIAGDLESGICLAAQSGIENNIARVLESGFNVFGKSAIDKRVAVHAASRRSELLAIKALSAILGRLRRRALRFHISARQSEKRSLRRRSSFSFASYH